MMKRAQHLYAILALPGTVTLVVPVGLTLLMGEISIGRETLPFPPRLSILLGCLLMALGLSLLVITIIQLARIGKGTLAPWAPPQKLVVQGIYRHVRNPMISGVFCILLGETILLGSLPLLAWFGLFLLAKAIYIPLHEEPELCRRFGADYRLYKQHVPRWLPRLTPWRPTSAEPSPQAIATPMGKASRQRLQFEAASDILNPSR